MASKFGIDISRWNGDFNMASAVTSYGVEFVIIKAGGSDDGIYMDSQFVANYNKAKNANIPCGLYWYTKAGSVADLQTEINYLLSNITGMQFELPLYLDLEEPSIYNYSDQLAVSWINTLVSLHYYPGIYSGYAWTLDKLTNPLIGQYSFWLAYWSNTKPDPFIHPIAVWQYSENGSINGGQTDLDMLYVDYTFIQTQGWNGWSASPSYTIRNTSPSGSGLPYYNTISSGGYNSSIIGNGAISGANVMNNCVGYSQGRMMEMYDEIYGAEHIDDIYPTSWEQGGIGSTGLNTGVLTRCRTGFINFNGYTKIVIKYPTGYRGYVFEYSSNNQSAFVQRFPTSGWIPTNTERTITINQSHYYRFLIARTDNANIDPNEALSAGFKINAYYGGTPITTGATNPFSMFNANAEDWYNIAVNNNFAVGSTPSFGAVGVWYSASQNVGHVANVEDYQNGVWEISEGHYNYPQGHGSWDYSYLQNNSDYLPAFIGADPSWVLIGFIYPFNVPTPVPPTPPLPPITPSTQKRMKPWLMLRNPNLFR